jgi:hypothetical protein
VAEGWIFKAFLPMVGGGGVAGAILMAVIGIIKNGMANK